MLRTIKGKVLAGTAFADVEKRERAGAKATNEAADRYVAAATAADVDTSALDDMSKPLHRVAAEADSEESERGGKRGKTTAAATAPSAPEPGLRASAPVTIRAALATKAKMLKASFSDFDTMDRDADEEGLALAVADAVASVYEGADPKNVFARFPVLLEACVGAGSAPKKPRKKPTRNLSSPFARTDAAKEIVAVAVDLACDGIMDDSATLREIEAKLSEAAEQVCDGADAGVIAEIIIESSKLLHSVGDDFATAPRQDTLANHIREGLYPAE